MIKIGAAEMIAWASPDPEQFARYAESEAGMHDICAQVTVMRRDFLLGEANFEIMRRNGEAIIEPEPEELNFSKIPVKFILTRNDFDKLAPTYSHSEAHPYYASWFDIKPYWGRLAVNQATLSGFRDFASKYDDTYYDDVTRPERSLDFSKSWKWDEDIPYVVRDRNRFQEAYKESRKISTSGYPIRMLMTGANYLRSAAIDMTTVEQWITWKRTHENDFVYFTPQSFWPHMVEVKRADDEAQGLKTYADVTDEVVDGVYTAPYIADEVLQSGDYFNFDDVRRSALELGCSPQAGTRAFHILIKTALGNDTQAATTVEPYFKSGSMIKQSGVVFAHRDILAGVIDELYSVAKGKRTPPIKIAEQLLSGRLATAELAHIAFN